jgi:hypothetical protein
MTSPPQLNLSLIGGGTGPSYSITCVAAGGTSTSGNYMYSLYGAPNCSISHITTVLGSSLYVFTGLSSGTYSVKVRDDNNCEKCVNITLP